ncbi:uncharacterized protein LOC128679304 isoform X2 [Plodia interpunctella]|uniref:uncharacterized protein LOC128679304 isoform X2 n=1 Tax=Plodia interpunctella TaxID=58824 RepID=UPI002368ACB6|nr:uncharacterized protein LOC128679304 isoform X2 [Plodia interpunctella]
MLSILRHVKSCYNIFLEYRCMSTVSLPDLHIILNEKGEAKLDFLYPFRKRAAPVEETPNQCSLAGQPKMLPVKIF